MLAIGIGYFFLNMQRYSNCQYSKLKEVIIQAGAPAGLFTPVDAILVTITTESLITGSIDPTEGTETPLFSFLCFSGSLCDVLLTVIHSMSFQ